MQFGKVVGRMVSTQKDVKLRGLTLLILASIDVEGNVLGFPIIAADTVGAGVGDIVLYSVGGSARQTLMTRDTPTDASIVGIVDQWDVDGEIVCSKA